MFDCDCEKCGKAIPGYATTLTAVGGRRITLCNQCANEFHAWLTGHAVYREFGSHLARHDYLTGLVVSGQQLSQLDWDNYRQRDRTIKAELFHITGEWLDEHKAEPEAAVVATGPGGTVRVPMPDAKPIQPITYGSLEPPDEIAVAVAPVYQLEEDAS